MKRYKLTEGGVRDVEEGFSIPDSMDNAEWLEHLKWRAEGNIPDPADPPVPPTAEEELNASDKKMIRAIDWLLQKLVQNGTIPISEVPPGLKALYLERKAQRGQ